MAREPGDSHPKGRAADYPLESVGTPWLQALLVPDPEGFRTHLLVLLRHAIPMRPDTTASEGRRKAHERDRELARRATDEDPRAAQELADRLACVPAMARSRNRKLASPLSEEELSDVVQNALVTLVAKLGTFEGRSSLETWAYGFVVRELYKGLDRLRRQPRRVEWDEDRAAELPDERDGTGDDYRVVHDTIHAIGPPGSEIIRMKHFERMTFVEIADELEMPLGSVKTSYYRGVERLRALLRPRWRGMTE